MVALLFLLMFVLAFACAYQPGAAAGLLNYIKPDMTAIEKYGIVRIAKEAVLQAFYSLGVGAGSLITFGAYMEDVKKPLHKTAFSITLLDTSVAIMSGLIVFTTCASAGIPLDIGPKLVLVVLPNAFSQIAGGTLWGILFFAILFMAAFSTIVSVFESNIKVTMDLFRWSRKSAILRNAIIMIALTMPCALGFNILSGFAPLGVGTTVLDLEDWIVSNLLLPYGCLITALFCGYKFGWGWKDASFEIFKRESLPKPRYFTAKFLYSVLVPVVMAALWATFFYKS